jgi:glycosyltransferase involved in cell wall biosynthesis
MTIDLTVVVLTYNEETRIRRCLDNLSDVRRCVIVDSGSTDRTVELAQIYGCDLYTNPWPGFVEQRNWAIENTGIDTDWVLFVDADEVYPKKFFEWFSREICGRDDVNIVMVPSYLYFHGKRLKFAPGYPIYHPRLVRRSKVRFATNHTGHGETISGQHRFINAPIAYDHYFYDGNLGAWLHKHVDHAFAEAHVRRPAGSMETRRGRISTFMGHSLWRVPLRFLYHFIVRQGFRDGRAGLEYALMYAWFEATKYLIRVAGAQEKRTCHGESTESSPRT